ncbi:MAG TPA: tripartite tricarboxylate transporter permease [Geminicoccaceae bacterium]|nr:tripartite tricarboxylate transporter permease [Geminicoccaceae bacterium]
MDILSALGTGFAVAATPFNLLMVLTGCFLGTIIGALPGIGPINGVAILMPIAYALNFPPESALILLAGVYYGAEYGGRVSSILLNVPGDAGAVMTTLDGHPMALRGEAAKALALSAVSSFIGGTFAVIMITIIGPVLASVAISFGPPEYVGLMVFAFATLAAMVGSNAAKTLIGAAIGLMIATIGVDSGTGVDRFTFGSPNLLDGIDFLVVVIGLFGISELFSLIEKHGGEVIKTSGLGRIAITVKDVLDVKWTLVRSSIIGFVIGVLPGTGASVASAVAYGTERRLAGPNSMFGQGDPRGLAAPEAANNASAGGAMVPMLTLGVPGSGTTAILLGVLLLFNITPGPLLFTQRPDIAWGLIASMYIGNVALLIINLPLAGLIARMIMLPTAYLVPAIAVLTFVGVFSVAGHDFELYMMIGLGVFGYILRKMHFSLAPVILGVVLGEIFEQNLRRSLSMSDGDWSILFHSPATIALWLIAAAVLFLPYLLEKVKRPQPRLAKPEVLGEE